MASDGIRERHAARVLLLRDDGRALLVRGHDVDQPDRSWWFTVGGGIDPGESPLTAAVREVSEETGIVLETSRLAGPIVHRTGVFDFFRESCRQFEQIFFARLSDQEAAVITTSGWTTAENEVLDELAWLSAAELRTQASEYFPRELPDIIDALQSDWDGTLWDLGRD